MFWSRFDNKLSAKQIALPIPLIWLIAITTSALWTVFHRHQSAWYCLPFTGYSTSTFSWVEAILQSMVILTCLVSYGLLQQDDYVSIQRRGWRQSDEKQENINYKIDLHKIQFHFLFSEHAIIFYEYRNVPTNAWCKRRISSFKLFRIHFYSIHYRYISTLLCFVKKIDTGTFCSNFRQPYLTLARLAVMKFLF